MQRKNSLLTLKLMSALSTHFKQSRGFKKLVGARQEIAISDSKISSLFKNIKKLHFEFSYCTSRKII